ncbi:hypothetical protein HK101_010595 [Irineochytrium annulatum]|nr:hypothetical protein HK101_010595 [Irineochytrium annulatum]
MERIEADYNESFLRRMMVKIDWPAMAQTAFAVRLLLPCAPANPVQLGIEKLPQDRPDDVDEALLRRIHGVIMEVLLLVVSLLNLLVKTSVKSGRMICPNCNHVYPIKDGIPNMLLMETALDKDLHFIIEILDDTHLFVDARKVNDAQLALDEILEANTYRAAGED